MQCLDFTICSAPEVFFSKTFPAMYIVLSTIKWFFVLLSILLKKICCGITCLFVQRNVAARFCTSNVEALVWVWTMLPFHKFLLCLLCLNEARVCSNIYISKWKQSERTKSFSFYISVSRESLRFLFRNVRVHKWTIKNSLLWKCQHKTKWTWSSETFLRIWSNWWPKKLRRNITHNVAC